MDALFKHVFIFEYRFALYGIHVTSHKIMRMWCDGLTQEKLGVTIPLIAQCPAVSSPATGGSYHTHGGHTLAIPAVLAL